MNHLSTHIPRIKMAKEAKPQDRSAVAERFITLRRRVGLSQSRLGEYLGLCRQAVNEIENCHVMLHTTTWERFRAYESRGQEPGIEHLPEHYWRDRLLEDESAAKGDTFCASADLRIVSSALCVVAPGCQWKIVETRIARLPANLSFGPWPLGANERI